MKMLKKPMLLIAVLISVTVLVSWNYFNNSEKELNASRWYYLDGKHFQGLTETEMDALITEDEEFKFSPESGKAAPPAEEKGKKK